MCVCDENTEGMVIGFWGVFCGLDTFSREREDFVGFCR